MDVLQMCSSAECMKCISAVFACSHWMKGFTPRACLEFRIVHRYSGHEKVLTLAVPRILAFPFVSNLKLKFYLSDAKPYTLQHALKR